MSDVTVIINGVRYVPAPGKQPFNLTLGAVIRFWRKERDMTLDELASKAGIGKSTVWELENDRNLPSFLVAAKLSAALNVPLDQLALASNIQTAA